MLLLNTFCLVPSEGEEEHWWRGCKILPENSEVGCTEHSFNHDGHEYLVDECVCDHDLCNKEMQPIPETTTKGMDIYIRRIRGIN